MTGLARLERTELDDVVTVGAGGRLRRRRLRGISTLGLRAGERLTVRELLYALLLGSANDAADRARDHICWLERRSSGMNRRAGRSACADTVPLAERARRPGPVDRARPARAHPRRDPDPGVRADRRARGSATIPRPRDRRGGSRTATRCCGSTRGDRRKTGFTAAGRLLLDRHGRTGRSPAGRRRARRPRRAVLRRGDAPRPRVRGVRGADVRAGRRASGGRIRGGRCRSTPARDSRRSSPRPISTDVTSRSSSSRRGVPAGGRRAGGAL